MADGELKKDDHWEIGFQIGALSHGLIMLYLGGRIDAPPARFKALYRIPSGDTFHGIRS